QTSANAHCNQGPGQERIFKPHQETDHEEAHHLDPGCCHRAQHRFQHFRRAEAEGSGADLLHPGNRRTVIVNINQPTNEPSHLIRTTTMKKLITSTLAVGSLFVAVSVAQAGWICVEFCSNTALYCVDKCF